MNAPTQVSPEERFGKFVVTQDGPFYWVRENDGSSYWPNRGLYFFKFFAIRRAKKLCRGALVNGHEIVVWDGKHV